MTRDWLSSGAEEHLRAVALYRLWDRHPGDSQWPLSREDGYLDDGQLRFIKDP